MSTDLHSVLVDPEYKNWLRAGLSLKYARQGILNLVDSDIDNFHLDVLTLLAGSHCNSCIISQTRGVFFIRCPHSVCDKIFTAISTEHRFKPAWKNTDCQMWCSDSWQLAKCYMSPGYASKVTAADTDFPGLVSVIINNRRFDNLVNDDMTKTTNVFCQARDVRNVVMHNKDYKVTDTDLAVYIHTLQTMLSDPKCSITDPDILDAIAKLTEIQNGSLTVTDKDEEEIRAEALSAIEKKKQEALLAVKSQEGVSVAGVKSQEGVSVAAVFQAGVAAEGAVEVKQQNAQMAIKQTADDACRETKKVLDDKQQDVLSAVTSQEAVSVKAVTYQEAVSVKAVTSQEVDSVKAVTSQEAESVAAVNKSGVKTVESGKMAIKQTVEAGQKVIDVTTCKMLLDISSKQLSSVAAVDKAKVEAESAVKDKQQDAEMAIKQSADVACRETKKVLDDKRKAVLSAVTSQEGLSVASVNKAGVETEESGKMAIKQTVEAGQKVLEEKRQDILSELSSVAAVNTAGVKAESAIKKHQPQDAGSSDNKKSVKAIDASRTSLWEKIKASFRFKTNPQDAGMTDNSVTRNRKALQKHLISIYREVLSTPLSPVFQIDDVNIEEMYVLPNMRLIDPKKEPKDKGVPINNYKDIFRDERKKKIYVLGDAGMGKTSLCKKMVSIWCRVNSKKIDNKSKDQVAMAKFDFLFYITLRDTVSIKGVEEMITHQLQLERFQDQLPEILENEKCLVILDGLDEWTTENTDARSSSINKGIPGRQGITNCTVLTTTRPSKFEAIQLKTTQIDTKVELLGIDEKSSEKLIETIIGFLNAKYSNHKTKRECLAKLEQSGLSCFLSIPVILKQLICLWYFGKYLGTTKCAIYSQMFELHLDLAESRLNEDPEYEAKMEEWKNSKVPLPSCFDDNPKCQQFKPLIVALSNISFETLVSDNQESSLVFNRSQAEFYGLTSQDINICLKIGILSQNKLMVDLFQMKKLSFLHKTFQEFLAALFVFNNQSNPEKFTQLMKTNNNDFDLDNVIPFISGMCSSETTCRIVNSCYKINQTTLENCLKEGWCCNHDNKHLQCDYIGIDTKHQPEPLELLCQANIHHMKTLAIISHPTARCLEYLLQVDTLEWLYISPWLSSPISEDNLYSLIHHNTHTLTQLSIWDMTLQSRTQLPILLYNIQHLSTLDIYSTIMSQQLLDSLQEFKAQRPDIHVGIGSPTILPDTE